ncbi:MAG: hypothetical protein ACOY4R_31460 [Pseudomonadota bacterium]
MARPTTMAVRVDAVAFSPGQAADRLAVKKSTVTSQLKAVFLKTGVSSQSQLTRLLVDLAAL